MMFTVVSSGQFYIFQPLLSILYRNVRFVLKTKNLTESTKKWDIFFAVSHGKWYIKSTSSKLDKNCLLCKINKLKLWDIERDNVAHFWNN